MTNLHAELVCTGSGLHANSQNPKFNPGREAVAKWAQLMFAGAQEIERLRSIIAFLCERKGGVCAMGTWEAGDDPCTLENCSTLRALESGSQHGHEPDASHT